MSGPTSSGADQPGPGPAEDRAVAGIACLCIGLFFFACQDAVVKGLADRYSVTQILLMRSSTAAPLLAAFVIWRYGFAGFRSPNAKLHAVRCSLVLVAFLAYYVAVSSMALVDVVALFSAAPLFITALAGPVLGERVGVRRWCAVGVGFIGVLIMLKPGSSVFNPMALLGMFAALAYSGSALIARRMGAKEPSALIAFYSNATFVCACGLSVIFVTNFAVPLGIEDSTFPLWRPYVAPGDDLALMMSIGLVTLAGFVLVPRAYQIAPASTVTPFEYTYLLWALLIGLTFFDEVPSDATLTGAALVVGAGIYIARREARLAKLAAQA
ncbi:MAG: DMT family transporter [Chromatiales bacterium]|jgi:drug/metabolite transporter (DMT)-like permease|nr:DMT family transporter [Chromatiales bacterium]